MFTDYKCESVCNFFSFLFGNSTRARRAHRGLFGLPLGVSMVQHSTKTLKKPREKALPYAEDFAAQLLAFFDVPPFKVTEVLKKDGSVSLVETACELPTFEAFAKVLGTTKATLVKWENAHPAFAEAAAKARDLQSNILIQNSLRGNYSSSFAVLTAKNLLGWKDGKDDAHCVQKPLVVRWGEPCPEK